MNASTEEVTKSLFRLAARVPFNIAPEKCQKLAENIFGAEKWEIRPSSTKANFYAVPADRAIYLSYAGLASLWSLSYACFHITNLASIQQRQASSGRTNIDIGQECANLCYTR